MFDLYKNIQSLCEEKGVSISKMSVEVGLSKSTLSNLKNGRSDTITKKTAQRIADYLGVTIDDVLHGKIKPASLSGSGSFPLSKRDAVIFLLQELTDEEVSILLSQIRGIIDGRSTRDGRQ